MNGTTETVAKEAKKEMDLELSPYEIWDSLTDVEETAVHVALYRYYGCSLPDTGTPLYDNAYDKVIVEACMPVEERNKRANHVDAHSLVAVRTAEIDEQLLNLLKANSDIKQVVMLGAGLDNRAWRLHWPAGTTVFEVDTGSLEIVKLKAFAHFHLRCNRVFIQADLTKVDDLKGRLRASGFKPEVPTIWLLEGLVGYLTRAQSYKLFRMMHAMSPIGSKVILTCPPNDDDRKAFEEKGFKLHHQTFEDADQTFQRLVKAGWSGHINKAEHLSEKYRLNVKQSQVIGYKPDVPVASLAVLGSGLCVGAAVLLLLLLRRGGNKQ